MKIKLLWIGKTEEHWIQEGILQYTERLKHYTNLEILEFKSPKTGKQNNPEQIRANEATVLLKAIQPNDWLIVLDENGKSLTSTGLAQHLENLMNRATGTLVLLIGGAYGFDPSIYQRANQKIALSAMTFTHQMVRLILAEQLYRAFTIIRNEPYHH